MPLIQDYNKLFEHTDNIKKIILNGNVVWPTEKPTGPDYTEPFYVENISNANETLSIVKSNESAPTLTIEYSTDKSQWTSFGTTSTVALTMPLAPRDKVYLRCNTYVWNTSASHTKIMGISKVGGNIMSLLYGDQFADKTSFASANPDTFRGLFMFNTTLQDASKLLLPATALTQSCYNGMFYRCASLSQAPALPATTLAQGCYANTFYGCTSLSQAPALLATTLVDSCYSYMFYGCTSLTEIVCQATSGINESSSTNSWLSGVSSTGTFYKKAGVTWPTGANGIPTGWTVVEV